MRCKCCDIVLNEDELTTRNPVTGEFEDMCHYCLVIAMESLSDFEPDDEVH